MDFYNFTLELCATFFLGRGRREPRMSLVSIHCPPSPTHSEHADESSCPSDFDPDVIRSAQYFTVRGAAVILSYSDSDVPGNNQSSDKTSDTVWEYHLHNMMRIVQQNHVITRVVRLQSVTGNLVRYLAVLETDGSQRDFQVALFGFDHLEDGQISIGLVLPLLGSTKVKVDGDGGISVNNSYDEQHFFKPVSIQAMWSLFQYVHKKLAIIGRGNCSARHADSFWYHQYQKHFTKNDAIRGLWHISLVDDSMAGEVRPKDHADTLVQRSEQQRQIERLIRRQLRIIMQSVDLDEVTSADIKHKLEKELRFSVKEHKEFIDREMLTIMGQLDKPSRIFDYLYLGTEWNASNWDELQTNNVKYILNVTKEVDNFYPNQFNYLKIWVSDNTETDLLPYWHKTYEFIKAAKKEGVSVLVHCKKGVSRSSSTVIAYCMKEYGWSLDVALRYVRKKRNCITPNQGFMQQLETFAGMLQASFNRRIFNYSNASLENCEKFNSVCDLDSFSRNRSLMTRSQSVSPILVRQRCKKFEDARHGATTKSVVMTRRILNADESRRVRHLIHAFENPQQIYENDTSERINEFRFSDTSKMIASLIKT